MPEWPPKDESNTFSTPPIVPPAPAESAPPWAHWRAYTSARIALGRSGGSQPTACLLDFRLSHARARDAVQAIFHPELLVAALQERGVEARVLSSAARSRQEYLLRPDLGRSLSPESVDTLTRWSRDWGRRDLVVIISDGLAAQAAERHAVSTTVGLLELLAARGWTFYPVLIIPYARVKLQDVVGEILGAGLSLMLLGERPGLGSPDSLGAYFTHSPEMGRTDADRNCLSNIRAEGLPPAEAAGKLAALLGKAKALGVTGVELKDEGEKDFLPAPSA